ncbi:MAG: hydroxymethylbilane synthase, partial [bacterium]
MTRIGTRGSALARWQATNVQQRLGGDSSLVVISTTGDQQTEVPLTEAGGIGVFTKELETALLANEIDIAVHSLKDLPTVIASGLTIGAIPERAPVTDVLLIHPDAYDPTMPLDVKAGTRIGTSSNRRAFQLQVLQPEISIAVIRGNIPTRVDKVKSGEYGAAVIAKAALDRLADELKLSEVSLYIRELTLGEMLPAPGQGALAIECRAGDEDTLAKLAPIDDAVIATQVRVERDLLHALGGGCNAPLGALVIPDAMGGLALEAIYFTADASRHVRTRVVGPDPEFLVRSAVHDLTPLNEALPVPGPLAGLTVLNTRPRGRGQQFTRALLMAGASVWVQPAILTVTRPISTREVAWIKASRDYDLAIFTSPAAAEHLCDAMSWGARFGSGRPASVVTLGAATTETVEEAGWKVDGAPRRGNTDSLLDYLEEHELMNPGCRVLYFRAEEGRDEAPAALEESGMEVDLVLPYRTLPAHHPALPEQPNLHVITFTSPSGVASFLDSNEWRPTWIALAIGPTTADACADQGIEPIIKA